MADHCNRTVLRANIGVRFLVAKEQILTFANQLDILLSLKLCCTAYTELSSLSGFLSCEVLQVYIKSGCLIIWKFFDGIFNILS